MLISLISYALIMCAGEVAAVHPSFMQYYREAEFAVDELKKLSDTGVYETLKLVDIVDGSREEGIYHMNTILKVELSSPHFVSGKATEIYNMVVMEHKDDKLLSFAIDEFPRMTDESMELFYIEKIKRRRAVREEAFRQMELQSVHFL